jgi:tetratricopeptide (TPR) repeat protein/DNA-binding XRE family transcriptional regulator
VSPNQALQQARIERHWTRQQVADQLGITWQTITLWEQGNASPDTSACQRLCNLFGKTAQELGLPEPKASSATSPSWFVPFSCNHFFTGREADLRSLHENFYLPSDQTQARVQVICGAGGIGKTQVALEYACRFRDEYATVLWLRTETLETLFADLIAVTEALDLPDKEICEYPQILSAVKRWLNRQANWLLILDNIEEMDIAHELLPTRSVDHMLLTTRRQVTDISQHHLNLQTWSVDDGVLFLLRRARLLPQHALTEAATDELRKQAAEICQELGGLPLALDQAGAYLEETGCTLTGYQRRFHDRQMLLLSRRGPESFAHPAPVTATILLAVERVQQELPAAAELLQLCSLLASDAIPEWLFTGQSSENLGSVLASAFTDPFERDSIYTLFNATSLVKLSAQTRLLTVHRLVQMVILAHMDTAIQQEWARRALLTVNQAFPAIGYEACSVALSKSAQLLPHAVCILNWIDRFLSAEQQAAIAPALSSLLFKVGSYLIQRGYNQKAQPFLERCLVLSEQIFGEMHPAVAEPLARLGYLLRVQGLYADAEALLQRSLVIYEHASPLTSSAPITILSNLAMISLDRGHYEQAEMFVKRLISIQEQLKEVESISASLSDLATIYRKQRRYGEAKALLLHAIRLREQTFGPEHPELLAILNNLANFYWEQGKYTEAKPVYLRALQLSEQSQGPDDSRIAMVLLNLGELYRKLEQFEESESYYFRALSLFEQTVGSGHLRTTHVLHGLALLRMAQGRYEEAEQFFQETLQIRERATDETHSDLAEAIHDMALLYSRQGKNEIAQRFLERALHIQEQVLGPMHPAIATSLYHLGLLYAKQGRKEQARSYYQRSLSVREQVLGKRHPETQLAKSGLEAL